MKHTFKYILISLILLVPALASAQNPPIYDSFNVKNGVATKKGVSTGMDENGYYTLTLETFATGASTFITTAAPADVILVLDLSSSMTNTRSTGDYDAAQTPSGGWTYRNVNSGGPYSVLYEGKYYQVERGYSGRGNNRRYFISFTDDAEDTHYLSGNSIVNTQPTTVNSETGSIYTGTLYTTTSETRLDALKRATKAFIDEIEKNDKYSDDAGTVVRPNGRLGNRISIITFNSSANTLVSLVNGELSDGTAASLKQTVDNFTTATGTTPYNGFVAANAQLAAISAERRATSSRTVVFFTDGEPYDRNDGNGSYPTDVTNAYRYKAIAEALLTKSKDNPDTEEVEVGYDAKVFSVGMFSSPPATNSNTWKFLQYVSSNAPNATHINNSGDGFNASGKFYYDVSDDNIDLSAVFTEIAQQSGGSERTVPSATQVVDGVTNSFTIPLPADGSDPTVESAQVTVYTRSINSDGDTWENRTNLTVVTMTTDAEINTPDESKDYMQDESKVGVAIRNGRLIVMGFNYTKQDADKNTVSGLTGNWVGWRYPGGVKTCAGKELVIEFKIQGDPDATGGDDTQTNTPDSGIFIPTYDDSGNFVGYEPINQYNVPDADIPINIVIKKEGMRHGESATIQIYRAKQSTVYNTTTGKLKPYLPNGKDSWENFSKVILTNWEEDGAVVTETLLCLDPTYVYLLEEDNWGWAYTLDDKSIDTSEQEKNPFIFTNTEKSGIVKHAEAASLNRFGNELHGRDRMQTVKSSKVESFTSQTASTDSEE